MVFSSCNLGSMKGRLISSNITYSYLLLSSLQLLLHENMLPARHRYVTLGSVQWPKPSEPLSVECQWSLSSQSVVTQCGGVSVHQVRMQQQVTLGVRGYSLANKDLFSKSDPYLVVSRPVTRGGWTALRTTETVKNDLNPVWRNIVLYESELPQNGEKLRLDN